MNHYGGIHVNTAFPEGATHQHLFVLLHSIHCVYIVYSIHYKSNISHMQKYSEDTAIVGCIRNVQVEEYRNLVSAFCNWIKENCRIMNKIKT